MVMRVYGTATNGRTARVLAVLFEKDVTDFELVKVALIDGDNKKPEHLALQPFGQIPVLVDGPLTLFESRAIARFIALKFESKGTALYGSTLEEKALVEQWLEVEGHTFNPPISIIAREMVLNVAMGGQPDEAIVEANFVRLVKVLDVYERHLSNSKYLAGDFFSLADLCHIPYINILISFAKRGEVIETRPHVKAWWEDISSRPAWKKVKAMIQQEVCNRQEARKQKQELCDQLQKQELGDQKETEQNQKQ